MKTLLATFCLLFGVIAEAMFEESTQHYILSFNDLHIARETRVLSAFPNGNYRYTAQAESVGLAALFKDYQIRSASNFHITDEGIDAFSYERQDIDGDDIEKDISLTLDSSKQQVISADGKKWQTEPGALIDDLSLFLALKYDVERYPEKQDFHYQVANGKKIAQQHFKREATETIDLGEGKTLPTIKLTKQQKRNKERKLSIWLAPDEQYFPVLIVQKEPNDDVYRYQLAPPDDD